MAPQGRLITRLHATFCRFQLQAKNIEAWVKETQTPVDTGVAEEILEDYSRRIGAEIQSARDELRRDQWMTNEAVHAQHDTLCFCIAVWELVHEMVVNSGLSAARLLHWYNRHYLDEDIAAWWQEADSKAEDPAAIEAGTDFWQPLCRLALSDRRTEVLDLLQRKAEAADPHVARVCEFLRRTPSLQQMDQAKASEAELGRATEEIQEAARGLLRGLPAGHAAGQLLKVYAGCSQEAYDAGEDVAGQMGRTWIEDLVYSHAWVFPGMRRAELAELLRAVARRRQSETIDDVDRALFAAITLDVPALLERLTSLPDRFPPFFVTHLVDVLYFAGHVPVEDVELEGEQRKVPPRDWHLMAYAKELCAGPRPHRRCAVDYLRAGSSGASAELLESAAAQYCAEAAGDGDMDDALALLEDLDLAAGLGAEQCWRRAEALREQGDLAGCLRWACRAEDCGAPARGLRVSELLDRLAGESLEELLDLLTPPELDEPLEQHPPRSLIALLARGDAPASAALAPSGRLYFFSQFARCRALRSAGRPARGYAPALVRLLSTGVTPPFMANAVVEELLPALSEDGPALAPDEALLLMRFVQAAVRDPLRRVQLSQKMQELNSALGTCLSRAVLQGPSRPGILQPARFHFRSPELVGA